MASRRPRAAAPAPRHATNGGNPVLAAALKLRVPTEDAEQACLYAWAQIASATVPPLGLLYAIPNGGYRSRRTAGRMKATGTVAGMPDLCLPVPHTPYAALYVELKRTTGGRVAPAQSAMHHRLRNAGNAVVVARGAREAAAALLDYLGIRDGRIPLPL